LASEKEILICLSSLTNLNLIHCADSLAQWSLPTEQ